MKRHGQLAAWVVVGVVGMAGIALGQEAPQGRPAAPAVAGRGEAGGGEAVVTRTYNVADLVRTTADYPFESAVRPVTGWGREAPQTKELWPATPDGGGKGKKGAAVATGGIGVEGLIEVVMGTIDRDSWMDHGGSIGAIQQLGTLLVVTQTAENHKRLEELLTMIREEYGPLKIVGVRVRWLLLEPQAAREVIGGGDAAVKVIEPGVLEKLGAEAVWAEGRTACFSGQTVYVASGRGRTVVTKAAPVVGTQAALYELQPELVQSGAVLQVTPLLLPNQQTAVLDLTSVVSEWGDAPGTVEATGSMGAEATTRPVARVDRVNVGVQQMRTTVRVPVGRAVVVGGMTREPGEDQRQLYLVAEVSAGEG